MTGPYHHGHLRDALLSAARDLLREGGVPALSLRELARRTGVSSAAPYNHFQDKAELVAALAQDSLARLDQASQTALLGIQDPQDKLRALGVAYVQFAVAHPAEFRIMFRPELSRAPDLPDLEYGPVFGVLMRVVDELHAVSQTNHDRLTRAISAWSLVHGLAALLVDGPLQPLAGDSKQVEELVQAVTIHLRP